MVQHLVILGLFLLSFSSFSQDERYYRQIFTGELPKLSESVLSESEHQFNVKGASYELDLNGDGIEEYIQPQKRDGVDWIEIRDTTQRKIFEGKLFSAGGESYIYKTRFVHLSPKVKVLVLFLDEGKTVGRRFESTARIFLLSFENNDLSTLSLTMGPHHFQEKEGQREQYWRRDLMVSIRDVNGDGVRDIIVEYNHIQRIMTYKKFGVWERL